MTVESVQGSLVSLECTGILEVFCNGGMTPGVPLENQVETASSSVATGMQGFPPRRSRETDPPLGMRRQIRGCS